MVSLNTHASSHAQTFSLSPMKKPRVPLLISLLLLAGCATPEPSTPRRGKLVPDPATPAATPAPVAPAQAAPKAAASVPVAAPIAAPAPMPPAQAVVPPPPPPPPPAPVATAPAPSPAPAPKPAAAPAEPLSAVRNGAVVRVSWTLPPSDAGYRAIEIMRNDRSSADGRTRVRAVRAQVTSLEDTVPDPAANYWYWLKLTDADGRLQNIGPVAAPRP